LMTTRWWCYDDDAMTTRWWLDGMMIRWRRDDDAMKNLMIIIHDKFPAKPDASCEWRPFGVWLYLRCAMVFIYNVCLRAFLPPITGTMRRAAADLRERHKKAKEAAFREARREALKARRCEAEKAREAAFREECREALKAERCEAALKLGVLRTKRVYGESGLPSLPLLKEVNLKGSCSAHRVVMANPDPAAGAPSTVTFSERCGNGNALAVSLLRSDAMVTCADEVEMCGGCAARYYERGNGGCCAGGLLLGARTVCANPRKRPSGAHKNAWVCEECYDDEQRAASIAAREREKYCDVELKAALGTAREMCRPGWSHVRLQFELSLLAAGPQALG
jgi:hypothetical protein